MFIGRSTVGEWEAIAAGVGAICDLAKLGDGESIRAALGDIVPEYAAVRPGRVTNKSDSVPRVVEQRGDDPPTSPQPKRRVTAPNWSTQMLPKGMQKPYEIARLIVEPALPYFNGKIRRELAALVRSNDELLDVGGRRSPYTVGLPARITILDLPRENEQQKALGLGVDDAVLATIKQRRSNIERVVLEDMTRCSLPSSSFDGAVAVEVIEHVVEDERFVANIARVLRPGGWAYFTTPNGDYIKKPEGGDHVRHYRREELAALLRRHFADVHVSYGIATGKNRSYAMRPWNWKPWRVLESVVGNVRNRRESKGVEERATKTAHLFAVARKSAS